MRRAPRRVLMTLDAVGGVWRYALDLASALAASGVATVFCGLGPQPSTAQRREAEAVGALCWLDQPLDWLTRDESELDGVPAALTALAEQRQVDLLHLNLPSQARGLKTSRPVVVVSHSCVVTWFRAVRGGEVPEDWHWQKRANRMGFDRADAVLAPSRSHAALLRQCYGEIAHLAVVHNAAMPAPLHAAERQNVVFAAGRWWDEAKNGAVLDAAAAASSWPVRMAGPTLGPNGQLLELRNAAPLGTLPAAEVRALAAQAGIFASPSLYEPFGLAVLEAALAGAPLVLADIPTFRELWGGAALFAAPREPAAFAAGFARLADDAALRADLGRRARARSARFTPAAQAAAVLEAYETALSRAAVPLVAGHP